MAASMRASFIVRLLFASLMAWTMPLMSEVRLMLISGCSLSQAVKVRGATAPSSRSADSRPQEMDLNSFMTISFYYYLTGE